MLRMACTVVCVELYYYYYYYLMLGWCFANQNSVFCSRHNKEKCQIKYACNIAMLPINENDVSAAKYSCLNIFQQSVKNSFIRLLKAKLLKKQLNFTSDQI